MAMVQLLLLMLLQAPPAVQSSQPLRSGCSTDDPQIAAVGVEDRIQVETALSGENDTCYKIHVLRENEKITGYVLGDGLPAIQSFIRSRERASRESAEAEARRARMQVPKKASTPGSEDSAKPQDPAVSTQFKEFYAKDITGKPVSLSGLNARAVVVTFWSPKSHPSQSQLMSVMPLYNEFHKSGLAAVGISMDPNASHISPALDDVSLNWPQIADQSGLAAHYNVDPRAGKTFVLDASHRVVAAGPMGPDIVKAVRQLMDTPPAATTPGNQ